MAARVDLPFTGMTDKAIALFEQAVRIDPDFEEGRSELSFALTFSGYPLRAVEVFQSRARPNQLLWPMVAYSDSGNITKALETARKYSPEAGHPTGWLALGILLEECGKPEEARLRWMEGAAQADGRSFFGWRIVYESDFRFLRRTAAGIGRQPRRHRAK